MQVPVTIDFHGMESSEFIEQRVRDRAAKLGRFFDRIVGCRVTIEAPHQRHQHGNLYRVNIALQVPGTTLMVNRDAGLNHAHEDVYVAIRDAFDAAERRLEDWVRKLRAPAAGKRPEATPPG